MNRREFVAGGSLAALATGSRRWPAWAEASRAGQTQSARGTPTAGQTAPEFSSDDKALQAVYDAALATLRRNVMRLAVSGKSDIPGPVLIEGSVYGGVWMECAPQEGQVYAEVGPEPDLAADVARNNHLIFFSLQKEDGQLPCSVKPTGPGYGQIQMVAPIAATAWELAHANGDEELLETAYAACGRWDAWLRQYRDTRGTGLCEGFCTYDTGQDNSPRWKGIPNSCPDHDARKCPQAAGLPRLCPDLSATVYGGRMALAAMAKALNKKDEADQWTEDAEQIRQLIIAKLYDPLEGAFYDLDADNKFVKIRSSTILNVLGEHVVNADVFETIWQKQVHNAKAFWAPYPFPSVALDDPEFVRPIPRNSWGGAAQALTALRATRWMEHYGKPAELAWMMQRWVEALMRAKGEFRQQLDPVTGVFTEADPGGYSPAALMFLEFLWRLSGVREHGELVEWNVHAPDRPARFSRHVGTATLELDYDGARAELRMGGRRLARVSGVVRLLTTKTGDLNAAIGIADSEQPVTVDVTGRLKRGFRIAPDQRVELGA